MSALLFIVETLLSLALFAMLGRLLLQLSRADFRNPVAQAIVRITNPLIMPLRRVLPPVRKVDTASVFAVLIVASVDVAIVYGLHGIVLPGLGWWFRAVALEIALMTLRIYFYAILLYALLSMIAPGSYSPLQSVLTSLCEPLLRPFRRFIPAVADIDLSPLWAGIAILAFIILLGGTRGY